MIELPAAQFPFGFAGEEDVRAWRELLAHPRLVEPQAADEIVAAVDERGDESAFAGFAAIGFSDYATDRLKLIVDEIVW
jgi:hypothetical protein